MDGNHPKRRKDKDNPYTIHAAENGQYILKAQKNLQAQRIERDKELLLLRAIFGPRP